MTSEIVKILNQEYLQNYYGRVLETWHQKCTTQRKQNGTYFVVAIATLLAPVSFCENQPFEIVLNKCTRFRLLLPLVVPA